LLGLANGPNKGFLWGSPPPTKNVKANEVEKKHREPTKIFLGGRGKWGRLCEKTRIQCKKAQQKVN